MRMYSGDTGITVSTRLTPLLRSVGSGFGTAGCTHSPPNSVEQFKHKIRHSAVSGALVRRKLCNSTITGLVSVRSLRVIIRGPRPMLHRQVEVKDLILLWADIEAKESGGHRQRCCVPPLWGGDVSWQREIWEICQGSFRHLSYRRRGIC